MARPTKYSLDDVLDNAMNTFWQQGYEPTSLDDLTKATGLGKGSLYNLFGGKRDLFMQAVKRYAAQEVSGAMAIINAEKSPRKAVFTLFSTLTERIANGDQRGCLLCNTAMDIGCSDDEVSALVRNSFKPLQTAFEKMLIAAGDQESAAKQRADYLLATYTGLQVMARGGYPSKVLKGIIETTVQQLPSPN